MSTGGGYTIANSISRLDVGLVPNEQENWMTFMKCWCYYNQQQESVEHTSAHQYQMSLVFANCSDQDVIYPLTVKEIAQAQKINASLKNQKDIIPQHLWKILKSYERKVRWSSLQSFNTMQSVGTTTTCNTLDTQDLKKHFTLQCTGKV